jgi:hypothetical protein
MKTMREVQINEDMISYLYSSVERIFIIPEYGFQQYRLSGTGIDSVQKIL